MMLSSHSGASNSGSGPWSVGSGEPSSPHAAVCGNPACSVAIVTAATTKTPFVFNGRRWVGNPHFIKPWWSGRLDAAVGVMFAGPGAIALGGELIALGVLLPISKFAFCGCVERGTLVETPEGLLRIEDIKVGDLVMSLNEASGEIQAKTVTDLIRPASKPLYALSVADAGGETEKFHATDDHPWKVDGRGWVETVNLKAGDRIVTGSGAQLTVFSLSLTERVEPTYNLTVADWHTFMVGEAGAVVHNACPIKGYTRHGMHRAIGDGGKRSGVKPSAILDAMRNPKSIKSGVDSYGRPFQVYTGQNARVVINPQTNQVISMNPLGKAGVR